MNCLAHLLLAHQHEHSLAGALLGDFVKGRLDGHCKTYPSHWLSSIEFHRQIDRFTDSHLQLELARGRFSPPYRRYAGIIVDLVFDHFLVHSWHHYSDDTLADFEQHCYLQLQQDEHLFPHSAQQLSRHIREHQLLSGYGSLSKIERALAGMGRRLKRTNPLHRCGVAITPLLTELEADFHLFYPQLLSACRDFSRVNWPRQLSNKSLYI